MTEEERAKITEYYNDKMDEFNAAMLDGSKSFDNEKALDMMEEMTIRLEDDVFVTFGINNFQLR